MKTILFFHREELTHLYSKIALFLKGKANVEHVVYSNKEAYILEKEGINNYINYYELFSDFFKQEVIDHDLLNRIDEIIIKYTNNRFNLNASIQSDRGISMLGYNEALLSAQIHYKCWRRIFDNQHVDILIHEPCSLFMNHIAAILCLEQKGQYLYHSQVKTDAEGYYYINLNSDNLSSIEIERNFDKYLSNPEKIDMVRTKNFIANFRKDFDVFFGNVASTKTNILSLLFNSIKTTLYNFIHNKDYHKITQNIDYWAVHRNIWQNKIFNILNYKLSKIKFEDLPEGEKYFYYSLHLEPEAVVLYLGDGIYANQTKLIENIASSLPPEHFLYVKDHPHEFAYRNVEDYKRLTQIPNVRLLKREIPGKQVIKNAIGVFTINGTAGFESLLLGKQTYCFGWTYYCYYPRVNYIHNIRDLRRVLYENQNREKHEDDEIFWAYINAFLDSAHPGYVNYFMARSFKYCADPESNAKQIANDLIKYAENF